MVCIEIVLLTLEPKPMSSFWPFFKREAFWSLGVHGDPGLWKVLRLGFRAI